MMNTKSICLLLILTGSMLLTLSAGALDPVSAHGIDVTPESTIVITDNSSALLAKKVVDETGVNATVYKFKSDADVSHQLEHAISNPNKKILAVAYQGTVNEFLSQHPDLASRIIVCSADENSIRTGLNQLNSNNSAETFLKPFLSGLLIGLVVGITVGASWMRKKSS